MLERLALLLSAFASLFKSTERLDAKNLVVPTENLIPYDERGLLKGARLGARSAVFCGQYQARFQCHR